MASIDASRGAPTGALAHHKRALGLPPVGPAAARPDPGPPRTLSGPAPHAAPPHTAALAGTGAGRTLPVLGTGAALFPGGGALYRRARRRTYG
ncbi:hypothetical protein [Streptomyces sp. SAI-229]|uniref:hypothetical protein n=1 Tax=Streptomyces sp. SAI-229 TaxID=3377731 RepID=UPI003C7E5584